MDGEVFVGRADELAVLRRLVGLVADGVGGVVMIEGEQGIGKSALLRTGLAQAAGLGCRVGWGAGNELGQRFPLRLMAECVGPEVFTGAWPERGTDGGLVPAGDPVLKAVERLLAGVDRLCARSPVVLVAEDLQWADAASLLAWRLLTRACRQVPLLVVGSCRAGASQEIERLLQATAAAGETVVSLGPLPDGELEVLVKGLAGGRPGPRLAEMMSQAGGNPLYVRELVEALMRAGHVRQVGGVAELTPEPGGISTPIPGSLAWAIEERLASVPPDTVQILQCAAALDAEFSVSDLAVVSGRSAAALIGPVDVAVAAGVVAEAGDRLAFRHSLIRQVLYDQMPASLRIALHRAAARELANAGASAERVAAQLVQIPGPADEWAVGWLAKAALVLTYQAPQVAADLLRAAIEVTAETDARREALEAALVTVSFLLARDHDVERAGRPLLARTTNPERIGQISWLVAYSLGRTRREAEAVAVVEEALARPDITGVWPARLRSRQAMYLADLEDMAKSDAVAQQALAEAEQTRDPLAAGYALTVLVVHSYRRRDVIECIRLVDQALKAIGDDPQTTDLRLLLLSNRISGLGWLDRTAEAVITSRQALVLGEQAGTPRLAGIRAATAELYFRMGQWDDARAVLAPPSTLPDYAPLLTRIHGLEALIAVHRDDLETATEHLDAGFGQEATPVRHRPSLYHLLIARALAAERAGEPGTALAELAQVLQLDRTDHPSPTYYVLPTLTRLAVATGDAPTASAAAKAAARDHDQLSLAVTDAAAAWCRGLADGDPAPLLESACYYRSAGRPLEDALAREDAADLQAARGEAEAARKNLAGAVAIYQNLGAAWDIRRADARLRRHGIRRHRAGSARPATGWHALTPTETQIAYLVADGKSNPDVAAQLFLSRNTVQTHVSHILAKLGGRSRADIIRQALDHPPAPAGADPVS